MIQSSARWDPPFVEQYMQKFLPQQGPEVSAQEAFAAVALAQCPAGGDILDCPCGFGRHSIALSKGGFRVVGIDSSGAMLKEARRRLEADGCPCWVQGDYRDLPFADGSFDVVLNLFTSLGFYGEHDDLKALAEIHRVLRPGGRLLVETADRDWLCSTFQSTDWLALDDGVVLLEHASFDFLSGWLETSHDYVFPDGTKRSFVSNIRVYSATELTRMLRNVGFHGVQLFGGLAGEPFDWRSRLVAIALR